MTAHRCKYYRDTGFKGERSWEDGTLLQFVANRDGQIFGVIFSELGGGLIALPLTDIRMERATPAEKGLVPA